MKKIIPVYTTSSITDNTYIFIRIEQGQEIGGDLCYYGSQWLNVGESWNNYQKWHNYYYMVFQFYLKLKPVKKCLCKVFCEYIPIEPAALTPCWIFSPVDIKTYTYNKFKAASKSGFGGTLAWIRINQWNTWDITTNINEQINRGRRPQNLAVAIVQDWFYETGYRVYSFRSSHYKDRAYRPYLEVEY